MTPRIAEYLKSARVVADIGPDTKLSAIKVRNTSWEGGSLVSLLFVDESPSPRYVLRVPRDPARAERVAANFRALQDLQQLPTIATSVPRPIFSGEIDGMLATLETFLEGDSLAFRMAAADRRGDEAEFARLLARATDWLWGLHEATWAQAAESYFEPVLSDTAFLQDQSFLTSGEADAIRSRLATMTPAMVPYARCHGDFNPNNLLLPPEESDSTLGVIDWEYSRFGCGICSLLHLAIIAYVFPAPKEQRRQRLHALCDPGSPVGQVLARAGARYANRVKLEPAALRPLYLVYLVRMAADHLRFLKNRHEPMRLFWRDLLTIELAS